MRGPPLRGAGSRVCMWGWVGAPGTRPGGGPGGPPVSCKGTRIWRAQPLRNHPSPRVPWTRRGRLRLDKLDPLLPGAERMTPPPSRCLCPPRAATQCCTNPCAPAAPFVHTAAEVGS